MRWWQHRAARSSRRLHPIDWLRARRTAPPRRSYHCCSAGCTARLYCRRCRLQAPHAPPAACGPHLVGLLQVSSEGLRHQGDKQHAAVSSWVPAARKSLQKHTQAQTQACSGPPCAAAAVPPAGAAAAHSPPAGPGRPSIAASAMPLAPAALPGTAAAPWHMTCRGLERLGAGGGWAPSSALHHVPAGCPRPRAGPGGVHLDELVRRDVLDALRAVVSHDC